MTFGVPNELASDGGPEFVADTTKRFLKRWDVRHRVSSAYYAQSNGRAELAVKSAKRVLRANVGPNGTLDNDRFLLAMLQLRNTPDPDCNVSPAEILFGRPLRDAFGFCNRRETFSNSGIQSRWREAWSLKELALRRRFVRWSERYNERTKRLSPLNIGDRCFVQNQVGPYRRRWDRSGLIVDILPYDKYLVKVDGSGRITTRNRKFLRLFKNANFNIPERSVNHEGSISPNTQDQHHHELLPPIDNDDRSDGVVEQPDEVPEQRIPEESTEIGIAVPIPQPHKPKLMLRRLQRYNSPGLQETEDGEITTRLRPR